MCALPLLLVLTACGVWSTRTGDFCASCEEEELHDAVKRHILARLHLRAPPNITHSPPRAHLLPALRRLHAAVRQDGRVELAPERRVEDSEIISFAERDEMVTSESGFFFFVSNEGNQTLFVTQASLWVYFRLLPQTRDRTKDWTTDWAKAKTRDQTTDQTMDQTKDWTTDWATAQTRERTTDQKKESRAGPKSRRVLVKLYLQGGGLSSEWRLMERRLVLRHGEWRSFDLTGALRRLFRSGERRQSVDLRCEGCEEQQVEPVLLRTQDDAYRPFLAVQARRLDSVGRVKRDLDCDESGLCCRRTLYIDFRLIGWSDWIIAPAGYYANYCEGQCHAAAPGAAWSFHTAVINQYRLRGLGAMTTTSASCCVPTSLRTMSMLYFDDQFNIVKRDVPSMIVDECGCS